MYILFYNHLVDLFLHWHNMFYYNFPLHNLVLKLCVFLFLFWHILNALQN